MARMDGHPCPVPKRVGIVHKVTSPEAAETALFVKQFLENKGVEVITDEPEVGRSADLVVVLGGDGTLIHAQSVLAGRPAMALSKMLGDAGLIANQIETHASITLEKVNGGFEITTSHLKVRAKVPGANRAKFEEIAHKAKVGCPVSKALNARITMDARLDP